MGIYCLTDLYCRALCINHFPVWIPNTYMNRPLLEGVTTITLEAPFALIAHRRATRTIDRSDFFKRTLDLEDEIARFAVAAEFLRSRGHLVLSIDATSSIDETADLVTKAVLNSYGGQ